VTDHKKPTLIWSEIDYDKKGKQIGVLHLPYSVTRSGYGMINIPIAVIRNGEGPSWRAITATNMRARSRSSA
jgi:predicted deacylase